MRWAASMIVLALVLPLLTIGEPAGAQSEETVEWFGPRDSIDGGWHMRVPVTVHNPYSAALTDAPVAAELDLAESLLAGGWNGIQSADRVILDGFSLDPDSIRVVEVTDFQPQSSIDPTRGRIKFPDDPITPSSIIPGLLGRSQGSSDKTDTPFDPISNPSITVLFRAEGVTPAGADRYYHIYFDTPSANIPPPEDAGIASASLDALHWTHAGIRLYGHAVDEGTSRVVIIGLHDETQVTVSKAKTGAYEVDETLEIQAGEIRTKTFGFVQKPVFRIDASLPVIAYVAPAGFVPSVDGGLVGDEFRFRTGNDPQSAGVYFTNVGTKEAVIHLNNGQITYRIEPGLSDGSNLECDGVGNADWHRLHENQAYHVVVDGGPILVQLQPINQQQIPSVLGAPQGHRFQATTQWSSPANCGLQQGNPILLSSLSTGTRGVVTVPEDPTAGTVDLPSIDPAPGFGGPYNLRPSQGLFRDRPLLIQADQEVRLFAGGTDPVEASLSGALGGKGSGRAFHGLGDTILIGLYPDTHVSGSVAHALSDRALDVDLSPGSIHRIQDDDDPVQNLTLESDRPIVAYALEGNPGFLAGIPAYLDAGAGVAEYRGRLLQIESVTGNDPVTGTGKVDSQVSFPLIVRNLGQEIGAPGPSESVKLDVGELPAGWGAELDQTDFTLQAGETRQVTLTVTTPSSGEIPQALVTVTARSQERPSVQDSVDAITLLKSTFGVGLWFDEEDGKKAATRSVEPGGHVNFTVVAKNLGSSVDTVILTHDTSGRGGSLTLVDLAGEEVVEVDLEAGETTELTLVVEGGENEATLFTGIKGVSKRAPAFFDTITAITQVRLPSNLTLTSMSPAVMHVEDGAEAVFDLLLENEARGSADVEIRTLSDAPDSWGMTRFFVEPTTGDRIELPESIPIAAGESIRFSIALEVPLGTAAHSLASLRVVADPIGAGDGSEVLMLTVVSPRHELLISPDEDPLPVRPGRPIQYGLTVENLGNQDEVFQLQNAGLPPGWSLDHVETQAVTRDSPARLVLNLTPAPSAAPGVYGAELRFTADDRTTIPYQMNLTVDPTLGQAVSWSRDVFGQPGQGLPVQVSIRNEGNRPITAVLVPAEDEWTLLGDAVSMAPGANATVTAVWSVPRSQPDGLTVHRGLLRVEDVEGVLPPEETPIDFNVDVARAELRIEDASLVPGAAGSLVRAVLVNDGLRPANEVRIVLVDGQETIAVEVVDRIEAGGQADILLATTQLINTGWSLDIDPDGTIMELDETNNRIEVSSDGRRDIPGFLLPGTLVLLIAVRRLLG